LRWPQQTRKREPRKSLHQPGWITLEGGFAARQCVVNDLSTTGARVTIDDRNMDWTARLVVTALTLAVIICIVLFERSGF
jgi:hypothetical protein